LIDFSWIDFNFYYCMLCKILRKILELYKLK
jgi:hypothetical protein